MQCQHGGLLVGTYCVLRATKGDEIKFLDRSFEVIHQLGVLAIRFFNALNAARLLLDGHSLPARGVAAPTLD